MSAVQAHHHLAALVTFTSTVPATVEASDISAWAAMERLELLATAFG
jgi:hypothetical protein